MSNVRVLRPLRFRAVWISDVHLGFRGSRAEYLLDFLKSVECEHLYLVGDIIDVWNMRRGVYWPQAHNDVLRAVLGKAKHGTRVTYVPGNHDEVFRDHVGLQFGNIAIKRTALHQTVDGRRLLILHGDEFDGIMQYSRFLAFLGDRAYVLLLWSNRWLNALRRSLGLGYWSLSAYLKNKVKNAVNYISNFEQAVVRESAEHAADGLICGHIHHAGIRHIDGTLYCNCGDWVESCTALVEHHDGRLEILRWTEQQDQVVAMEPEPARGVAG
ncbi:MAG: UDP-2,3-diacylglucosamine diphosphatase [Chromatiales bacterium]|jgi:UDP-2,3-diacylglucosamine pyrophosphatase LpxH